MAGVAATRPSTGRVTDGRNIAIQDASGLPMLRINAQISNKVERYSTPRSLVRSMVPQLIIPASVLEAVTVFLRCEARHSPELPAEGAVVAVTAFVSNIGDRAAALAQQAKGGVKTHPQQKLLGGHVADPPHQPFKTVLRQPDLRRKC